MITIKVKDKDEAIRMLKADDAYYALSDIRSEVRLLARGKKEVDDPVQYIYDFIIEQMNDIGFDSDYK